MQTTRRTIVLLAGLALAPSLASAQSGPRACLDWRRDPMGPLPRKDVDNILYRSILFKRAGLNYDAETFSDMSPAGAEHCFRWEIVNSTRPSGSGRPSDQIIDELTWPAAGIRVRRMQPGDKYRDFASRRDRVEPLNNSNLVFAFEGERTPTQSWMVSQDQQSQASPGKDPEYKTFRTQELLPNLKSAAPSVLQAPVTQISFGGGRLEPPGISQVVGYGDFAIRISSGTNMGGDTLVISTIVELLGPPSGDARFSFPGLTALQQSAPKSVGDQGEAERFLEALRENVGRSEPNRSVWKFENLVRADARDLRVFRILQPVIVSVGEERHCYLASTYTPIAIGLSLAQCW
jgi:hypothetical protein